MRPSKWHLSGFVFLLAAPGGFCAPNPQDQYPKLNEAVSKKDFKRAFEKKDFEGLLDIAWKPGQSIPAFEEPSAKSLVVATLTAVGVVYPDHAKVCEWVDWRTHGIGADACVFVPHLAGSRPLRVMDRRAGGWYQLDLTRAAGALRRRVWVRVAPDGAEYADLEALLKDGENQIPYLAFNHDLHDSPGGKKVGTAQIRNANWLKVLETRRVNGRLWLLAEIYNGDRCAESAPAAAAKGWMWFSKEFSAQPVLLSNHGCGE